jgi:hypothetical protein
MLVAVSTNPATATATASRFAALSKSWTLCLCAVRTRLQPTLDIRKHGKIVLLSAGAPQPNCTVVMLVESDVRGGIDGILP